MRNFAGQELATGEVSHGIQQLPVKLKSSRAPDGKLFLLPF
jgi:hypothetical protein